MWADPKLLLGEDAYVSSQVDRDDVPVLVLDLSPEARERRVEQIAKALATCAYSTRVEDYQGEARAVLASLGDTPAGEGRGK